MFRSSTKTMFTFLILFCGGLSAQTNAGEAYLKIRVSRGQAEGYTQTPAGGNPGTSSLQRPSLDELGVTRPTLYEFETGWRSEKYMPYFGSVILALSGTSILQSSLVSQGLTFENGSRVRSTHSFDGYRVGMSRRYEWLWNHGRIVPKLEVAILDFNYELKSVSPTPLHVRRSYTKVAPRLGLDMDSNLTENLSLHFDAAFSLFSFTPNPLSLTTAGLALQWVCFRSPQGGELSLILGGGLLRIELDDADKQELPNHLFFEQSPHYSVGMEWSF